MRIELYSFKYLRQLRYREIVKVIPNKFIIVPGALLDFRWSGGQRYGMILSVDEKNEHIQVLFGE